MANYTKTFQINVDGVSAGSITVPADYDIHNLTKTAKENKPTQSKLSNKLIKAIRHDLKNNKINIYTNSYLKNKK